MTFLFSDKINQNFKVYSRISQLIRQKTLQIEQNQILMGPGGFSRTKSYDKQFYKKSLQKTNSSAQYTISGSKIQSNFKDSNFLIEKVITDQQFILIRTFIDKNFGSSSKIVSKNPLNIRSSQQSDQFFKNTQIKNKNDLISFCKRKYLQSKNQIRYFKVFILNGQNINIEQSQSLQKKDQQIILSEQQKQKYFNQWMQKLIKNGDFDNFIRQKMLFMVKNTINNDILKQYQNQIQFLKNENAKFKLEQQYLLNQISRRDQQLKKFSQQKRQVKKQKHLNMSFMQEITEMFQNANQRMSKSGLHNSLSSINLSSRKRLENQCLSSCQSQKNIGFKNDFNEKSNKNLNAKFGQKNMNMNSFDNDKNDMYAKLKRIIKDQ